MCSDIHKAAHQSSKTIHIVDQLELYDRRLPDELSSTHTADILHILVKALNRGKRGKEVTKLLASTIKSAMIYEQDEEKKNFRI